MIGNCCQCFKASNLWAIADDHINIDQSRRVVIRTATSKAQISLRKQNSRKQAADMTSAIVIKGTRLRMGRFEIEQTSNIGKPDGEVVKKLSDGPSELQLRLRRKQCECLLPWVLPLPFLLFPKFVVDMKLADFVCSSWGRVAEANDTGGRNCGNKTGLLLTQMRWRFEVFSFYKTVCGL